MMTKLDPVQESIQRCVQFRGPLAHETEVRNIATEILAALKAGNLTTHDVRTIADALETGVRKAQPLKAV